MKWYLFYLGVAFGLSTFIVIRTLMKRIVVPDMVIALGWIWGVTAVLSFGTMITREVQANDRKEKEARQEIIHNIIDDYNLKSLKIWWDTDGSIYDHKIQFLTKDGQVCDGEWYEFGGKYYLRDDASCEQLREKARK